MAKSITIAFPNGGILPAEIAGNNPAKIEPHKPVSVPEAYGMQLINDRFAVLVQPAAKQSDARPPRQAQTQRASTTPAPGQEKPDLVTLGKAVGAAKTALKEATNETRPALQLAYDQALQALSDAKAKK